MLPAARGSRSMPRKIAGRAMMTIEPSTCDMKTAAVVFASATHWYRESPGRLSRAMGRVFVMDVRSPYGGQTCRSARRDRMASVALPLAGRYLRRERVPHHLQLIKYKLGPFRAFDRDRDDR